MTSADDHAPAHRSRWQRFSPSMGWKAFWSEIVIVVLGVVIALAANEAVEQWSWDRKVADGEILLQEDIDRLFGRAAVQYAVTPCVEAQLESLVRSLVESGHTLTPAPLRRDASSHRSVLNMPTMMWLFPTWDAFVANGTAPYFDDDRRGLYENLSDSAKLMERTTEAARDSERRLMAMTHPIDLDPHVLREFLVDLEGLRARVSNLGLYSSQIMAMIADEGIAPDPAEVDESMKPYRTVKYCKEHGLPVADWREAMPDSQGR